MLFTMLCLVFVCILGSGWRMSKSLGISMFVLYFLFVAASLAFEYGWVHCPL
jgi:sodium/potassium/calcium exchanger 2